jgi:hypothetical protein
MQPGQRQKSFSCFSHAPRRDDREPMESGPPVARDIAFFRGARGYYRGAAAANE